MVYTLMSAASAIVSVFHGSVTPNHSTITERIGDWDESVCVTDRNGWEGQLIDHSVRANREM